MSSCADSVIVVFLTQYHVSLPRPGATNSKRDPR